MEPRTSFGEFFKKRRIALGLTLREFCKLHGLDPGNISKIERSVVRPPESRELMERYCHCLEIKPGTDAWLEISDLAAWERGKIPADLVDNSAVLRTLPTIFRTFRNKQISEEKINELIEALKKV